MHRKTLWIHAGGAKTGTSAIQNFLALNQSGLNSLGFSYRNQDEINSAYDITAGNGFLLFKYLSSSVASDDGLDDLILSYFDERTLNAICSSEMLQDINESGWKKIIASCLRLKIKIEVIFIVRNVAPYVSSAYDQVVKRYGEWRLLNECIGNIYWPHASALRIIDTCFPKENKHIFAYDRAKNRIVEDFIEALGINTQILDIGKTDAQRIVNRSLTIAERNLLRRINRIFGQRYSAEISDVLIKSQPNLNAEPEWDPNLEQVLAERYRDDIVWINKTFFGGKPIISVGNVGIEKVAKVRSKKQSIETDECAQTINNIALDWAISKLAVIESQTRAFICGRLAEAIKNTNTAQYSDLPPDFDAASYLALNSDVLMAGSDPVKHYVTYGRAEGRRYLIKKNGPVAANKSANLMVHDMHSSQRESQRDSGDMLDHNKKKLS